MAVAKPIPGKSRVLFFRKLGDSADGIRLALQTEHSWEYENDVETTATKDGSVNAPAEVEITLSIEAILTNDALGTLLKNAVLNGDTIEVWDVNLAGEKQGNKYPALYARGKLTKWEDPAKVGEFATLSTELKVDGKPQEGFTEITEAQENEINYVFAEMKKAAESH